ncbi:MAG: hypothetical protein DRJ61_00780 [Acidobacteria bacterium]|nr:MAG: hypothetical protein DRJ65_01295 [Acidobacteriota bacterium]RLE36442.1 MAG: hypothetical protein DRJ61_00780 [Acidobacteriota bacterium]
MFSGVESLEARLGGMQDGDIFTSWTASKKRIGLVPAGDDGDLQPGITRSAQFEFGKPALEGQPSKGLRFLRVQLTKSLLDP